MVMVAIVASIYGLYGQTVIGHYNNCYGHTLVIVVFLSSIIAILSSSIVHVCICCSIVHVCIAL